MSLLLRLFRYSRPVVAAYQGIAGAVLLLVLGDAALRHSMPPGSALLSVMATLFLLSGVLLATRSRGGLPLATVLQAAQVIWVVSPWLQYYVVVGVIVAPAIVLQQSAVSYAGLTFRLRYEYMLHAFVGRQPSSTIVLGVNFVALGMLLALRAGAREDKPTPNTSEAAPPRDDEGERDLKSD